LFTIVAPGQNRLRAGLQAEPQGLYAVHCKVYPKPKEPKSKKTDKKSVWYQPQDGISRNSAQIWSTGDTDTWRAKTKIEIQHITKK
jgi:hypothetical protein